MLGGISRFGWSWLDAADLDKLHVKAWTDMNSDEITFWKKGNFLKDISIGDWVVHINLPEWGKCMAGQVIEPYSFEKGSNEFNDYRHMIKLAPSTVVEFKRNDERVLPIIYSRLVLPGRYWRIYQTEDFLQTVENLKSDMLSKPENESVGLYYLKQKISPILESITDSIQKTHPSAKLETLIAEVFRNVPGVIDVKENGRYKGFGTDYGADLIVVYKSGLPIADLMKEEILVVQVKSFENDHWETNAVTQIETAITNFKANSGLIITTGKKTLQLEKAIEEPSSKLDKPVNLIAGDDVAKFVLTHGSNLLFKQQ